MPADIARDLVELFQTVVRGGGPPDPKKGPFIQAGTADDLLFQGRSEVLLRDLERRLARSALEHGGPSPESVSQFLIDLVERSAEEDSGELLKDLSVWLDAPQREWEFAQGIAISLREGSVRVGACWVYADVPDRFLITPDDHRHFRGGSAISTEVAARDERSALHMAEEHFTEARAILALATNFELRDEQRYAVSKPYEGRGAIGGPFFSVPQIDYDGNLAYEFGDLSRAAASPTRNPWERRVLAAARWLLRARLSHWPAEQLVAAMVALEAVFVPKNAQPKKYPLAKGATAHARLADKTREDQEAWLVELYERRNDVAHEGQNFMRDADIARLIEVTFASVRWAAWHLSPWHSKTGKACASFDEAMAPHDL